jgi:hypothetical protein
MFKFSRMISTFGEDDKHFLIEFVNDSGGFYQVSITQEEYEALLSLANSDSPKDLKEDKPSEEKEEEPVEEEPETSPAKQGEYEDDEGLESI